MKKYTIDVYNTKTKKVCNLDLNPMSYKQAKIFKSKFTYRKHIDFRLKKYNDFIIRSL